MASPGSHVSWYRPCGRWPLRPEANARCDVPALLPLSDLPCTVCARPLASTGVGGRVATHLVTHPSGRSVGPRTLTCRRGIGLATHDVVQRLVERCATHLVVAASAGDQEMAHARPSAAASLLACRRRASIRQPAARQALGSGRRGICSGWCLKREAGGSSTLVAHKASVPAAAAAS
jgi:hypothetical protein